MTPIQSENPDAQKQLKQWLKDADLAELSQEEQGAIGSLLAELQDLPSASISPQLEGRLQSLSRLQPTPSNFLKRALAFLSAGLATAGAVLLWQSSGLKLEVVQKLSVSRCCCENTEHATTTTTRKQRVRSYQQPRSGAHNCDHSARESHQLASEPRLASIASRSDLPSLG